MLADRIFFHPSAADGVRQAMEAWLHEGGGRRLLLEIAREIEDRERGRPATNRLGSDAAVQPDRPETTPM